jgi:hypothetical protein
MKPFRSIALPIAGLLVGLAVAGCKIQPTYKAENLASDLKKMIEHDYGMGVETRHEGGTLQTFFWRVGMLKPGQTELHPEAAEALQRVLLCATRVSLSTDAKLQFVEVKLADALTGATVTIWRFVPDIRDSMYTRIADEEYLNRLVVEFKNDLDLQPKEWKDAQWDPPMTLPAFLAKQVVLRAKRQSAVGLQAHEDITDPSQLVVVFENWPTIEKEGAQQRSVVTDLVEKTARTVVKGYRFTGFRELVLKDQAGIAVGRFAL